MMIKASRVIARISKIPVQNSNFKISALPDSAIHLLYKPLYQLHLKAVCVKMAIYTSAILYKNFCLSVKEVVRKLPVQKTGRTGSG